jgi:hypothetical protein
MQIESYKHFFLVLKFLYNNNKLLWLVHLVDQLRNYLLLYYYILPPIHTVPNLVIILLRFWQIRTKICLKTMQNLVKETDNRFLVLLQFHLLCFSISIFAKSFTFWFVLKLSFNNSEWNWNWIEKKGTLYFGN